MKRKPSLPAIACFSMFSLGFACALLVAVTNPGVAQIMAFAALIHGVLAVASFGIIVYEVSR